MSQMNINSRARQILGAITQEYLATGEAVGSRTVTKRYGVDLSPATVRNVMSDLEELGLIRQPHTSAGRIPTALGLRFFVDSLLTEKVRQLSPRDREDLASRHDFSSLQVETALRETGKVLSELSTHTVVVMMPRMDTEVLKHIEFLRVRDDTLLAVLVSNSGRRCRSKTDRCATAISSASISISTKSSTVARCPRCASSSRKSWPASACATTPWRSGPCACRSRRCPIWPIVLTTDFM
jgi:heat shock gene repressor HrcA